MALEPRRAQDADFAASDHPGLAAAHGWTVLGADSVLLSEVLRGLGYHTAVVGKFHANPRTCRAPHHGTGGPFGCGFDRQYGFAVVYPLLTVVHPPPGAASTSSTASSAG